MRRFYWYSCCIVRVWEMGVLSIASGPNPSRQRRSGRLAYCLPPHVLGKIDNKCFCFSHTLRYFVHTAGVLRVLVSRLSDCFLWFFPFKACIACKISYVYLLYVRLSGVVL